MQRWQPGQRLRVLPVTRPGHSRVPGFLEGQLGTVLRDWGDFPNPEARARGDLASPPVPVYLMVFDPAALWPSELAATAASTDHVLVDVYHDNLAPDDELHL